MTRKFKSTITDWVAEKDKFSEMYKLFNTFGARKGSLPIKMVENSKDWEEITEKPILVTEDGYEVYSYHNTLKEVTEDFEILPIDPDDTSKNPVFHEIANAKAYIERHKPKYSDEDLNNLLVEVINRTRETKVNHNTVKDLIDNLKALRND